MCIRDSLFETTQPDSVTMLAHPCRLAETGVFAVDRIDEITFGVEGLQLDEGFRLRLKSLRQGPDEFAQERGARQQQVQRLVARRGDRDPDVLVVACRNVVWETRQIGAERLDRALSFAGQPAAPQRIAGGLGEDDERLVRSKCNAIGEGKAIGQDVELSAGSPPEQPARRLVFDQVTAPMFEVKFCARVGEVDGAFAGHGGVVAEDERYALESGLQGGDGTGPVSYTH